MCAACRTRPGRSRNWLKIDLRFAILARDSFACVWCGGAAESLDHVVPRSDGGGNEPGNVVAACFACNRARSDYQDDRAFVRWLRARGIRTGGLFRRVREALARPVDRLLGRRLAEEKYGSNAPRLYWTAAGKAAEKAARDRRRGELRAPEAAE